MNIVRQLVKISLIYWRNHKTRLITFVATILIGGAALTSAALLIRSEKAAIMEEELRRLGNYDIIIYGLSENSIRKIKELPEVDSIGYYTELGYVSVADGIEQHKAATFESENDEDMYHMTCLYGQYPKNIDEIAIDLQTAKAWGIRPKLGEMVTLNIYSLSGEKIGVEQYKISGLFEAKSDSVWGGWYRYPTNQDIGSYKMPAVFFSNVNTVFAERNKKVTFLQTQSNKSELALTIYNMFRHEITIDDIETPSGRTYAYSYVMGISFSIWEQYGDMSFQSVMAALRDENVIKDFYSGILVPIFNVLIFVVAFIASFGIVKNIINDKREMVSIIRSVGVSATVAGIYVFLDLFLVTTVSVLSGIIIGCLIHPVMIWIQNYFFNMKRDLGFVVNEYVNSVTVNPYIYSAITMLFCFLCSGLLTIISFVKKTPSQLLSTKLRLFKRTKTICKQKGWKKLILKKISFFDKGVFIISTIIMGTLVFGYVYFCALAEQESVTLIHEKEEAGLLDFDYIANKMNYAKPSGYNIENRHSLGIPKEAYREFAQQGMVDESFGEIWNMSTRITYGKEELTEEMIRFLSPFSLRVFDYNIEKSEISDYDKAVATAEVLIHRSMGYEKEENVYAVPTLSFSENLLEKIIEKTIIGEVDRDALNRGDEILLVIPEEYLKDVKKYFPVGSKFPLSDIILNEVEEELDFNNLLTTEAEEYVVFYEDVMLPGLGELTPIIATSFGKRKEIDTIVGAIAVMDEEFKRAYLPKTYDYLSYRGDEVNEYGIYAVCGEEAFGNWELPDKNYTRVGARMKKGTDMEKADNAWYTTIGSSKGMSVYSTKEITERINTNHIKNMSTFSLMAIMLILVGLLSNAICLYSRIRMQGTTIAQLRAVGIKRKDIYWLIIRTNVKYSMFGVVFALGPVCVCQIFFLFIRKMIDSGMWGSGFSNALPWYTDVPYRYDLFSYHIGFVIFIVFLIYSLVICIATIPQLLYIKKQKITDELELNSF